MPATATPSRLIRLTDGVHAYVQHDGSWWLNNAAIVHNGGETLLFDTCATAARTDLLLRAVESLGAQPPTLVACSHPHSDHTHGLSRVSTASAIIAHRNTRAEVAGRGIVRNPAGFTALDPGPLEPRAPNLLVNGRLTACVGATSIELITVAYAAHSNADMVGWLPDAGILLSGDLAFNGVTPLLMSGSVSGAIRALEDTLLPLGAEVVVPGHGPVAGASALRATLRYCRFVEQVAEDAWRLGRSPLTAAQSADLGEFADWLDSERLVANVHRALAEREGIAPGARIDFARAMADMAQLAGVESLRTLAGEPCEVSPVVEELDRQHLC